ncbi:MAG: alpha/beta hydrolase [Granulosicoccus sp.]|nr:alpha/beta hydrolase [Granulosicoccus sp.]
MNDKNPDNVAKEHQMENPVLLCAYVGHFLVRRVTVAMRTGWSMCVRYRLRPLIWCLLCAASLSVGCASPTSRLKHYASEQGFARGLLDTGDYDLLVFDNQAGLAQVQKSGKLRFNRSSRYPIGKTSQSSRLHVYLEGDGLPWRYRTVIMPDPTPRSPLMLTLMAIDPHRSIYLGRPCYNGTSEEPPCNPSLWTSGRYSETVVQSMAAAIRVLVDRFNADELWLFGHSGGGTLAMLLAPQLSQVSRVVTIAGNLDTDAWTDHHNYTRLYNSANPARLPPLPESIEQWHLLGGRDSVIPPSLVHHAIKRQPAAHAFMLPGFSHGCCWGRIWPSVINALEANDRNRVPGRPFKLDIYSTSDQESQ